MNMFDTILNRIIKIQVILVLSVFLIGIILSLTIGFSGFYFLNELMHSEDNSSFSRKIQKSQAVVPNRFSSKPKFKTKNNYSAKTTKINDHNFTFHLINGSKIKAKSYKNNKYRYIITSLNGTTITINRSKVSRIDKFN